MWCEFGQASLRCGNAHTVDYTRFRSTYMLGGNVTKLRLPGLGFRELRARTLHRNGTEREREKKRKKKEKESKRERNRERETEKESEEETEKDTERERGDVPDAAHPEYHLAHTVDCRGTLLMRNSLPPETYSSICRGPCGGPRGGGLFLMSEVPLYQGFVPPKCEEVT